MKPREYQVAAADALWNALHSAPDQDPIAVMPTGSGKSLTMAMLIAGLHQVYPWTRLLSVVHVKELVEGNYRTLLNHLPTAPAGIYSAGVGRKDLHTPITFCGIDSVAGKEAMFGHIDFLIIDEAHRISDKDGTSYQKLIQGLRAINPKLVVIGFTATDYRLGMGKLTDGGLFDRIAFDLSSGEAFVWMIQQGYLIKPVPRKPSVQVDASRVSLLAGEFNNKAAAEAFSEQHILEQAVDEIILNGKDRRAWLTFAQSIEHAELLAEMFRARGLEIEAVHSKRKDRDEVLAAFQKGQLLGVVNKDILTTGYDNHNIDLMAILRLTNSPSLWVQMLGRGTRPLFAPGFDITTQEGRLAAIAASPKHNCLVLDFAGNSERLGPINYPTIPKKKGRGGGPPPSRACPECGTYNHISFKVCEECGYEFPVETKLHGKAASVDLVLDLTQPLPPPPAKEYGVFGITQMVASINPGKNGKLDTLRVNYFSGVRRFSAFICFNHPAGSYPQRRAADWWHMHRSDKTAMVPASVEEALARFDQAKTPRYIKVWLNTKYEEIEGYDFVGTAFAIPPELGGGLPPGVITVETPMEEAKPLDIAAYRMVGGEQIAETYSTEDFA